MLFSIRDAMARAYESYRLVQRMEKCGTAPKDYGMEIQGKRRKKKRGK